MAKTKKDLTLFSHFDLDDEDLNEVRNVFTDIELKEQLPELFLQLSPFTPNKPGPKAKYETGGVVIENMFGSITLRGTELVIQDENVLLAILSTKKEIEDDQYYFVTSFREIADKCKMTWRGAKFDDNNVLKGNSTPKQILGSIERLWLAGLSMSVYKTQQTYNIGFIDSFTNPMMDENKTMHYLPGVKDQLRIRISKEYLSLYNAYKKYTLSLEQRTLVGNLVGISIHRYLTLLTTFKHSGIHKERLELLITKINWTLPRRSKESEYVAWREVQRQLESAKKGLKKVGIVLELPDSKLSFDSIIVFKNSKFYQLNLELTD